MFAAIAQGHNSRTLEPDCPAFEALQNPDNRTRFVLYEVDTNAQTFPDTHRALGTQNPPGPDQNRAQKPRVMKSGPFLHAVFRPFTPTLSVPHREQSTRNPRLVPCP